MLFRSDQHGRKLDLPVSAIQWKLLVDLNALAVRIINFLPESEGVFICIDDFHIECGPSVAAVHAKFVASPAIAQAEPLPVLAFILCARAQARRNEATRSGCGQSVDAPNQGKG